MDVARSRRFAIATVTAGPPLLQFDAVAQSNAKLVYGVPGTITTGVAFITFAQELGFADTERLDIEMIPLVGSSVIFPQLLSGQLHAAGPSIDPLVVSKQPGKPQFPLKFFYKL